MQKLKPQFHLVLAVILNALIPLGEGFTDELPIAGAACGNGICEASENERSCSLDCCSDSYKKLEQTCIRRGWEKKAILVDGLSRLLLIKKPAGSWKRGAIIALHGGGGAYSNFCGDIAMNDAMGDFSDMAVKQGFAVFALDSTTNLATDPQGRPIGKRWDSLAKQGRNVDLAFIGAVMAETIPESRPEKSAGHIFLTGVSNGGFMAIFAATRFQDKITAFAPVSAGDPYGAYFDMSTYPAHEPNCAFGTWRDNETQMGLNEANACFASDYKNEKSWIAANPPKKLVFKQFHHQSDGVCDLSCMQKAQKMLVSYGYADGGAFVIKGAGGRNSFNHLWKRQYNKPMLDFFKSRVQQQEE